jgi:ketosteroid isomerase-like protein
MSEDQVEQVRLAVDAVNRHDLPTLDAMASEQFEFHSTFAASEGRVFRGRDGVRDYFDTLDEVFDDMQIEIEEITDAGENRVVVVVRVTGRGKGSGANVEQRNGQVWRFADLRIVRIDSYMNPTDAFDAVGRGGFEPPTDGL